MAYTGLQENHYPNPIPHPFVQHNLNYLLQCHRFHDIWTSCLGWNMVESMAMTMNTMNGDVVLAYGEYIPLAEQKGQLTCVENVTLNDVCPQTPSPSTFFPCASCRKTIVGSWRLNLCYRVPLLPTIPPVAHAAPRGRMHSNRPLSQLLCPQEPHHRFVSSGSMQEQ